ncbi:uncharacterized protein [Henckelia pumila]|uniref:uncharacterized protein isoform X2 n=1 Tax=Henckelia pumila TaxID=405737 RepID=UPI003C6E0275
MIRGLRASGVCVPFLLIGGMVLLGPRDARVLLWREFTLQDFANQCFGKKFDNGKRLADVSTLWIQEAQLYHCCFNGWVVITDKYGFYGYNVGEDGGFAPNISSLKEGLDLIKEAIERTGYNEKIKIAIDIVATEFCIGDVSFSCATIYEHRASAQRHQPFFYTCLHLFFIRCEV